MDQANQSAPLEIERKYLLRAVPPLPRPEAVWRIEQGYLPEPRSVNARTGEMTGGRLRRVTHEDGSTKCWRTIKSGVGVVRSEIEKSITPAEFESLWPRTAGARLRKTRHRIREGHYLWEIDVLEEPPLVLAEVELHDPSESVAFPPWLSSYVVADVSDDPRYTNAAIAMRSSLKNDSGPAARDS